MEILKKREQTNEKEKEEIERAEEWMNDELIKFKELIISRFDNMTDLSLQEQQDDIELEVNLSVMPHNLQELGEDTFELKTDALFNEVVNRLTLKDNNNNKKNKKNKTSNHFKTQALKSKETLNDFGSETDSDEAEFEDEDEDENENNDNNDNNDNDNEEDEYEEDEDEYEEDSPNESNNDNDKDKDKEDENIQALYPEVPWIQLNEGKNRMDKKQLKNVRKRNKKIVKAENKEKRKHKIPKKVKKRGIKVSRIKQNRKT